MYCIPKYRANVVLTNYENNIKTNNNSLFSVQAKFTENNVNMILWLYVSDWEICEAYRL